ncbi:MAG TPA: hypothetical protein VFH78_13845 [Candidatus Thermoplasmatota archaeon]|nr:hypothetical protein [Candidatus Thermoplasmatota archaeon]
MRTTLSLLLLAPLVAAGCVDAPAAAELAAAPDAAAPVAPTATPFAQSGMLGPGAYVCPVVTCAGVDLSQRGWDADFRGTLVGVNLTLTWDAATPLTEDLVLGIGYGPMDGRSYELVTGSSPLALELADLSLTAKDDVRIFVFMPVLVPMGAAMVLPPQEFRVEGTLLSTEGSA